MVTPQNGQVADRVDAEDVVVRLSNLGRQSPPSLDSRRTLLLREQAVQRAFAPV